MKTLLSVFASLLLAPSVFASFHLMQVEQVIGSVNGDTSAQAIQLRMRSSGQNLVSGARVRAWDAAGANPVLILDMTTNVSISTAGSRVLLATGSFTTAVQAVTPGYTPDFTMANPIPVGYLAAGRLTFEDDSGTILWSLAWGGASYTGSHTGTTNDDNGNFGPAFAQGLPTTGRQGLIFQGASGAQSTTNTADYALSANPATVTKNNGANSLIGIASSVDATLSSSTQPADTLTPLVVHVTGITTGESVIVERFLDVDGDGMVDGGEFLVDRFTITDGQVTTIGGVRNTNIPGDEDSAADGQIDMHLTPAAGPELGRGAGAHIIRVSSPTSAFTAIDRTLTTTQPSHAQSISGTVRDAGSNPVPFAIVALLDALSDGEFVTGVSANASGQFTVNAAVGTYMMFGVKTGFVGNFGSGPTVVLGAGQTPTQNIALTATTTSISGKVADAGTNAGLPGVQLFVQSQTGLVALLSTNANGNYSAQVTAGLWQIETAEHSLFQLGYVIPQGEGDAVADTTSAAATGVNIGLNKATALIYGTVKDQSNNPVNGVEPIATDQGNSLQGRGLSAPPNGNYSLGVLAGTWSVSVAEESLPAGYIKTGTGADVTISAGQAVQTNLTLSAATAHLRGQIRDDAGTPIPNITLVVQPYPMNPSGAGSSYPTTDASGNFDVGVYAGTWNIALECVESQEKSYVNVADLDFVVVDGVDQNGIVLTFPVSTHVITGKVKDTLNNPIAGVVVDADAMVGSTRYFPGCVATDANGDYTLRVLDASWQVSVRNNDLGDRGYDAVSSQNVIISGNNGVANFVAQDTTLPTLTSSQPANAATGVVLNSTVSFTFSERMQTGVSITWSPNVNANQFTYLLSLDQKTLVCTYSENLPANATIGWTLNPTGFAQNISDIFGNALASDVMGSFTTGTALGVPEIAVEQSSLNIADSGAKNFGPATTGSSTELEFTVKNVGSASLQLSGTPKVVVSGTDAARFTVISQPASPVAVSGSTSFTVRFAPTSAGLKTAALSIANNDGDENPFNITLSGLGITAVPPVVTTLAASSITVNGAVLNGTVNAKGTNRDVTFKYGTTTAYGTTVMGTPGTVSTNAAVPVSVTLTNLLAHTKYNFLVRADGTLGAANGANMSFTTLDTAPHADDDNATALPGGVLTLAVLNNDHDDDGDTLKLSTVKSPAATAGTAKIVGSNIVFTAAATFAGTSFDYTISDGFGKTDTGTVTITLGSCVLNPPSSTVPAAATNYPVTVTATGTWSAIEALPWATVTPLSGSGNGAVTVTLQANTTKLSRRGVVTIGGKEHVILQAGNLGFTFAEPAIVPVGMVSADYTLTMAAPLPGVKFGASGLPTGLGIHATSGVISGKPKAAGTFKATITGAVAATGASTTIIIPITIQPLPAGAVGTFSGPVMRAPSMADNVNLGGRIDLTTTSTGSLTGKIILGAKSYTFPPTAVLNATLGSLLPTASFMIARTAPLLALQVSFTIDSADNRLISGDIFDGTNHAFFDAWRNVWITPGLSAPDQAELNRYLGLHTFALHVPAAQPTLPQGSGIGSFTVAAKTGALTAAGKLADGTGFTSATFAGPEGEVLLFQSLYSNQGSILGKLEILAGTAVFTPPYGDNTLIGTVSWLRPAIVGRLYSGGFGPYNLTAVGGRYVPPAPATSIVMSILDDLINNNSRLTFTGANFVAVNPSIPFRLKASSVFVKPAALNNPASTTLTVTPATGAFTGGFSLSETNPLGGTAVRPATYYGQIVRDVDSVMRGYGFFILADLPQTAGQTVNNTNQQSGLVVLEKHP